MARHSPSWPSSGSWIPGGACRLGRWGWAVSTIAALYLGLMLINVGTGRGLYSLTTAVDHEPMTGPDAPLQQILTQRKRFGHREHLELAWTYLRTLPRAQARQAMRRSIRHVAQAHDAPDRYHETLTLAWMHVVDLHLAGEPPTASFEEFLEHNERLLDSRLLEHHYSRNLLNSDRARREYVAPDRQRFPALS